MKTRLFTRAATGACLALLLAGAPVQAASSAGIDENLSRIERILDDVDRAKEIITGQPSGSGDVARAQERLRAREADLERARVDAMAAAARVSRDRVISMRAQGRSWGSIANELGVSLRVVGIGGRHGDDEQGGKYWDNQGKHKGWKHGMPPGQAKKMGYDD
ncbi:MAG: hypothetical protein HY916_02715 [Desulfovibrio sp.]|jgi:hypothetical protein|nr:hypothetical protein [Desulfovibrio sp.]